MNNEFTTNINWYPGHMEKTKKMLLHEYKNIDLVYEVIDARIPRSSKIKNIYDVIGTLPKILIMTKKDLADPQMVEKWLIYYKNIGTNAIAVDLNDEEDIAKIIKLTNDFMTDLQAKREEKGIHKKEINVLVIGIPNVGKSTLINRLVGRKVAKTGNTPGVTKHITWLKTKHNIALLDTPGILWPKLDNAEVARNLVALSAIKLEVVDVNEIGVHILNKLNRYYPEKLKERYDIDASPYEINIEGAYQTIASKIGAMKKGEVLYEKVSIRLINDIKDGYIKGITFDNEI